MIASLVLDDFYHWHRLAWQTCGDVEPINCLGICQLANTYDWGVNDLHSVIAVNIIEIIDYMCVVFSIVIQLPWSSD